MAEAVKDETEVKEAVTDLTQEVASFLVEAAAEPSDASEGETEGETKDEGTDAQEATDALALEIPELPEDLARDLMEAEVDLEVESQSAKEEETQEDWYQDDDETQKLKKELAKAKKREAFLVEQNISTGTPGWRADAEKYFPLSAKSLDDIKATSKRDFLRQAKAKHESILPMYEAMKTAYVEKDKKRDEVVRAEIRAELEAAWGTPTSIPSELPDPPSDAREKIQSVRRKKSLAETIKLRLQA